MPALRPSRTLCAISMNSVLSLISSGLSTDSELSMTSVMRLALVLTTIFVDKKTASGIEWVTKQIVLFVRFQSSKAAHSSGPALFHQAPQTVRPLIAIPRQTPMHARWRLSVAFRRTIAKEIFLENLPVH